MTSWLVGLVSLASLSRGLLRAWLSEVLAPYNLKIVGNQEIKPWIDSVESTEEIQKRVKMGKKVKSTEQPLPYIPQGPLAQNTLITNYLPSY